MDIYDSRYFRINKGIMKAVGLWPYASRSWNYCSRTFMTLVIVVMFFPQEVKNWQVHIVRENNPSTQAEGEGGKHVLWSRHFSSRVAFAIFCNTWNKKIIRLYKYFGKDLQKMLENIMMLIYIFGVGIKGLATVLAEERMKIVYENIAKDFQEIIKKEERNILFEYSENGRIITIFFTIFMLMGLGLFTTLPLLPIILDKFMPLNESRIRILISNGDFLMDSYANYGKIYFFDVITISISVALLVSTDPMYAAVVEHCLALFDIIKYRLKTCTSIYEDEVNNSDSLRLKQDIATYKKIVQTIQMHNEIITFTRMIEKSYTTYFLLELGVAISLISTTAVILLLNMDTPTEGLRFIIIVVGVTINLFYIIWPGQKLIDHSSDLFQDTYLNNWYKSSIKCQNLLKFMALRCVEPCHLTAGGLYILNFINFAMIVKTSVSYFTVLATFQ